jgi:hypothetical protein
LSSQPLLFPADKAYKQHLQECTPPATLQEQQELQRQMGFKYRQVMGEFMFPMVKCRPDISPHLIYLSQLLENARWSPL